MCRVDPFSPVWDLGVLYCSEVWAVCGHTRSQGQFEIVLLHFLHIVDQ